MLPMRHLRLQSLLMRFTGVVAAVMFVLPSRAAAQASIGTVTCKATVDNTLAYFAVGGTSYASSITALCGPKWENICTFTFPDYSWDGQVVALYGDDAAATAAGSYCPAAGLALTCSSTNSTSGWNKVKSDTSWKSYSAMTPLSDTSWAAQTFVDTSWGSAVASSSKFTCTSCGTNGAGEAFSKIWACVRACMQACEECLRTRRLARA